MKEPHLALATLATVVVVRRYGRGHEHEHRRGRQGRRQTDRQTKTTNMALNNEIPRIAKMHNGTLVHSERG